MPDMEEQEKRIQRIVLNAKNQVRWHYTQKDTKFSFEKTWQAMALFINSSSLCFKTKLKAGMVLFDADACRLLGSSITGLPYIYTEYGLYPVAFNDLIKLPVFQSRSVFQKTGGSREEFTALTADYSSLSAEERDIIRSTVRNLDDLKSLELEKEANLFIPPEAKQGECIAF